MKTLHYVKILLLCVFAVGLASCGDDNYYTIKNSDDKLCAVVEAQTTKVRGKVVA